MVAFVSPPNVQPSMLLSRAVQPELITTQWLMSLGFHDCGLGCWRLWLPDYEVPECLSFLQLVAPSPGERHWSAEIVNEFSDNIEPRIAAIPKPLRTQGNVLLLIQAVGGLLATSALADDPA